MIDAFIIAIITVIITDVVMCMITMLVVCDADMYSLGAGSLHKHSTASLWPCRQHKRQQQVYSKAYLVHELRACVHACLSVCMCVRAGEEQSTSEKMRTVASPVGKAPRKMLTTLLTTSDGP